MTPKIIGFYPRASLGFARKIDTDLIAFTRNVITLMTGNTHYPTPSPALAMITTSVNDFETAVQTALDGGKIAIATRNASRNELLSLLRQLAAYVTGNCKADVVTLISSGFRAVKTPSPVGVLSAPQNLRLEYTGMSGQLLLRFDRVQNANNYTVQTAENANGPWQDQSLSTTSRVRIEDLTPGKVYWVRACANGSQGPSEWGGPATAMAV